MTVRIRFGRGPVSVGKTIGAPRIERVKKEWRVIPVDALEPGMLVRDCADDVIAPRTVERVELEDDGFIVIVHFKGGDMKAYANFEQVEYYERRIERASPLASALALLLLGFIGMMLAPVALRAFAEIIKLIGLAR